MSRFPLALIFSLALTLFAEQASAEGRRVALVVGVSAYESVPKLPNAVNDASAMADLFRKAGFDVVTARSDVGNLALKRAIREFEDAVADADIAVVYYAGHGIEIRDQNYLIPTDAKLVNERDADDEAIPLDRVITALEPAKRLRLIILDACRDNPFASKIKRRVATRAISSGLARVEPSQTDTLIAYAAKEKNVANDGDGEHSPFTTALLANLTVPGLDVRLAFGRVRDDVLRATRRQQEPFVYGSLGGGTVALVPAAPERAVAPAAPRLDVDLAKSDYEIVERVGKKEAWEVFLNTHKSGLYADLARVQLAKLGEVGGLMARSDAPGASLGPGRDTTRDAPKVEAPPVQSPPKPSPAEQRAWDKIKASTDQAAIRKFLADFPASPLVPVAQERLETLERLARQREETLRIEREAARQKEEDEKQKLAAEAERKRIEKEAARQKEEEARAKAVELARQKAEALAAAKQREAEEKAKAAEELARRREEEERVKAAALAERQRQAEERAKAAEIERRQAEREAADRRREIEEAARVAAAAKAAREAEERTQRAKVEEARKSEAAKAAEIAAQQRRDAEEKAKAAALAAQQKQAEDRAKAAEAARIAAERDAAAKQQEAAERAKMSDADRQKERAAAEAERRKAQAAAEEAAERKAERAAAAKRREAAEEARREAAEEAAANRRKAADIARRASERQAERAAAAAEQRRASERAAAASEQRRRAAQARPAPAPRARAEAAARPAPRSSGGGGGYGGGGGSPSLMGIGF